MPVASFSVHEPLAICLPGILPEEQGTENFFVDETHVYLVLNSIAQGAFVIRRRRAITFFPARNRRLDDFRADVNFFAVEFTP